jgi:RNA polymerase sigma-70 factor (ECF subfamily)
VFLSHGPDDDQSVETVLRAVTRSRYDEIFRFVRRRTTTSADAEDMTQTVFLQAAEWLAAHGSGDDDLPLLYTIARRRLIDDYRRRPQNGGHLPADDLEIEAAPAVYGGALAQTLKRELERLPEPQRRVVTLRLITGRSFSEIAAETGSNEGACKMRFRRGLDRIRDALEKEGIAP